MNTLIGDESMGIGSMRHVVINGGGIGGLALAAGLAAADGIAFTVIEQSPALRAAGAGIVLAPNAQAALDAVGVHVTGRAFRSFTLTDATGRCLSRSPTAPGAPPSLAVSRSELLRALSDRVPASQVRLGGRVVAFDGERAHLASGDALPADVLIGADGIHSAVRALAGFAEPPVYAGYRCWRTLVPESDAVPDEPIEAWGHGTRAGIVPLLDGQVYLYLCATCDRQAELSAEAVAVTFHDPVPSLAAAATQWHVDDITEHPSHRWRKGRLVLLGDASHALTPNLGQGAAMALEDAASLARAIASPALDEALDAWVTARAVRVAWVARASRQIGRVAQWRSPGWCTLRDVALRFTPPWMAQSTGRRLFTGGRGNKARN